MTTAMPEEAADPASPTNMGAPMLVANVEVPICNAKTSMTGNRKYHKLLMLLGLYASRQLFCLSNSRECFVPCRYGKII